MIDHPTILFLKKWREELTVFLAGMLSVRGLPPHHDQILMMVGLAVLIAAVSQGPWKRGARLGFLFGLGHHLLGFSWLLTSLHQHGELWMGVALLILAVLAATMAIYVAVFGGLLVILAPRPSLLPLAAPPLWVACEWLRSHLFTGFPWNLVGYGWNNQELILQIADLGGIYLLSWLMVFPAAVMALVWREKYTIRPLVGNAILVSVPLILATGYGLWRSNDLSTLQKQEIWGPHLKIGMVQGNIEQKRKWDPDFREEGFLRYLDLSRRMTEPVDLVVWPETALTFFLQSSPESQKRIVELSQHLGAPLLAGLPMANKGKDGKWLFYNSMVLLDTTGTLERRYNKHHLVPFGEFIPFRYIMPPFIKKLTYGTEDFSRGHGPVPLPWEHGAIGGLVCYETIFPHEVRQLALASTRWLVNVTNDAWFGESAKPQHLAMARFRAVENRLPMIRVANTGISAIFDQMGHELGRIPANTTASLAIQVPQGLGHSLFQTTEPWWIIFWVFICTLSWFLGFRAKK